mmetsp:Transcript_1530/g.3870  ORF Transcript_1530/g.3870 Transcript_1530/m.3870 type:complete len:235 (-) Transcript_1530:687-1391(-)
MSLEFIAHHAGHIAHIKISHVVIIRVERFGCGFSLFLHLFVVHFLFAFLLFEKCFFGVFLGFFNTICNNNVIEECSSHYLPDFESHMRASIFAYLVHVFVILVFRIVYHRMLPCTLVVRIINHLWFPHAVEIWIVDHRCLPFTIVFFIPIFRFLGVRIRNFFWLIIPVIRLLAFRIHNLGFINPIFWLFSVGIFDCLQWQKVEVLLKRTLSDRFVVDQNFERIIGVDDQGVKVC